MGKVSNSAQLRLDQIPFMISTLGDISNDIMFVAEEEKPAIERLDALLKSWNFSRLEVPRDGNCLFYAAAYNLKFQLESGNTELERILENLGIVSHHSLTQIANSLRQGVANEWIGNHSKEYQKYMTCDQLSTQSDQLRAQATQFQQEGVYSLDIGDLVIAGLSNMLQSPVVLFTSRLNQPLHIQYPTYSPMLSPNPVYLAYLQAGSGHYDAVVQAPKDNSSNSQIGSVSSGCTCGQKSTFKGTACSFSLNMYSSRCPCYNKKHPCSHLCKCKGCTNSFGTKPEVVSSNCGKKRKREPYENQEIPLKGKRTLQFMEAVGEPALTGGFSKMEFLMICSIVQNLMADNLDWKLQDLNHHMVFAMYSGILELVETLKLDLALFKRTHAEIEKLLRNTTFKWDIFSKKNMILE